MTEDTWFANLVCPVSAERGRQDVVRLTALFVALLTIAYLVTRVVWIPVFLLADFLARASGRRSWSVLGRLAQALVARTGRASVAIDLAPKQFAARVGVLFTLGMTATHAVAPIAALVLGGVLTAFALLESVGNVCAGCLVYSYVMMPLVRRRRPT
jgi:Domain of unknown function (DUF4395)